MTIVEFIGKEVEMAQSSRGRRAAGFASAALLGVLSVVGAPVAAGAQSVSGPKVCAHPAEHDYDKSGYGHTNQPYHELPVRTGPYGDCPLVLNVGDDTTLWYHCYLNNSYGNAWTYVRIGNTDFLGWIADSNLDNGGSNYHC